MKSHVVEKIIAGAVIFLGAVVIFFFRNQRTFEESGVRQTGPKAMFHAGDAPTKENVSSTYQKEIEQLTQAVEKNPNNAGHVKALAQLLMDGHQMVKAIPYYEQAVKLEPNNDSLLFDLSVCYFSMSDYGKALSTTEKILSLGRRRPEALYNKGVILAAQGKTAEAGKTWKQLIAVAPNSEEAKKAKAHLAQISMK